MKFAIFKPEWILNNGEYGMIETWRCYAFRVLKDKFERLLKPDLDLTNLCQQIDAKNFKLCGWLLCPRSQAPAWERESGAGDWEREEYLQAVRLATFQTESQI